MKYQCNPGWFKERIIEQILTKMQDHRAVSPNMLDGAATRCRYRAEDRNVCAVGAFLPDSEYRIELEGLPVTRLPDRALALMPLAIGAMSHLQDLHDNWVPEDADPRPILCSWIADNVEDASC